MKLVIGLKLSKKEKKKEKIYCYIIFIEGHIFALTLIVALYEVIRALGKV